MKNALLLSLMVLVTIFGNINANAEELSGEVFIEYTVQAGFGPPDMMGTSRFQVMNSGVIQSIDNKDNVTQLGTLSLSLIENLKSKIELIKSEKLNDPKTPLCMDAPSTQITVKASSGKNMVIWKNEYCEDLLPLDPAAITLSETIIKLEDIYRILGNLK